MEELGVFIEVGHFITETTFRYPEKIIRLLAYEGILLDGDFTLDVHDMIDWVKIPDLSMIDLADADIPITTVLQKQYSKTVDFNSEYYESHFQEYSNKTCRVDPAPFLSMLSDRLQKRTTVLDIGCGSGRDLLWLKKKGYEPTGFERSPNLAELARQHSGCPVLEGDFVLYDFSTLRFDALLLIGSLVHLGYSELGSVLIRISEALKDDGFIYLTLKEGNGLSHQEDGRVFTLWQVEHLESIFRDYGFVVLDFTRDISAVSINDMWLSYLLKKEGNS